MLSCNEVIKEYVLIFDDEVEVLSKLGRSFTIFALRADDFMPDHFINIQKCCDRQ